MVLRDRWTPTFAYYDPKTNCEGCPHRVCDADPATDEPQPGYGLDPDHWLLCPAQKLSDPRNQWVYRVLELYRHYKTGNLSCWVDRASEALSTALVCTDNAVAELQEYVHEKAKQEAKSNDKKGAKR